MTKRRTVTVAGRVRIFDAAGGICHVCGLPILVPKEMWHVEHVKPLWLGGADDDSNMRPVHLFCHKGKSAEEAKPRAKGTRIRAKHLGLYKSKNRPMPGSKASGLRKRMDGRVERR